MNRSGIALVCCLLVSLMLSVGCAEPAALGRGDFLDKHMTLDLGGGVTMKMALIPTGKFIIGSPDSEVGRSKDEGPQREVTISKPFYIGVHEVTQTQWTAVMKDFIAWKDQTCARSGDAVAAS